MELANEWLNVSMLIECMNPNIMWAGIRPIDSIFLFQLLDWWSICWWCAVLLFQSLVRSNVLSIMYDVGYDIYTGAKKWHQWRNNPDNGVDFPIASVFKLDFKIVFSLVSPRDLHGLGWAEFARTFLLLLSSSQQAKLYVVKRFVLKHHWKLEV